MWQFDDPMALLLLAVIPLSIYLHSANKKRNAIVFSDTSLLDEALKKSGSTSRRKILLAIKYLALMFLILALSRPQLVENNKEILTEGIDIILCLDTSGSMQAMDFEIEGKRLNRLEVAKKVVSEFINGRKNDRIGMVVFAANAYTQCPLTLDYHILQTFLNDNVEIGIAGDGTAVGSAIGMSVKRLKDSKAKSKVVILLTDGRNNTGKIDPITAAKIAKQYGIKVYTIGAGTEGPAPFPVEGVFGKRYVYQRVDLDEKTLKNIADITGAEYFRATDTQALESIYKKIDSMEKSKVKVKEYRKYTELFYVFLIPGTFLLVFFIILENTVFSKIP